MADTKMDERFSALEGLIQMAAAEAEWDRGWGGVPHPRRAQRWERIVCLAWRTEGDSTSTFSCLVVKEPQGPTSFEAS